MVNNLICLTHGPYISIYHIVMGRWVYHLKMKSPVYKLFRQKSDSDKFLPAVLLENGEIFNSIDFISGEEIEMYTRGI
jgi:hypothetical protein